MVCAATTSRLIFFSVQRTCSTSRSSGIAADDEDGDTEDEPDGRPKDHAPDDGTPDDGVTEPEVGVTDEDDGAPDDGETDEEGAFDDDGACPEDDGAEVFVGAFEASYWACSAYRDGMSLPPTTSASPSAASDLIDSSLSGFSPVFAMTNVSGTSAPSRYRLPSGGKASITLRTAIGPAFPLAPSTGGDLGVGLGDLTGAAADRHQAQARGQRCRHDHPARHS